MRDAATDRPLVVAMCLAHFASMWSFSAYPTLLPTLREVWGMSNTEAGLVSGMFFAGYMIAVPVLTSLTDRLDARHIYAVAAGAAAIGSMGMGLSANGAISAGCFQMLLGVGIAGTYMPGLKALSDRLRGATQSRAIAFYTATFGIGLAFSVFLAGKVGEQFGWRVVFIVTALGPVIAAAIVLGRLRAVPRANAQLPRFLDFRPALRNRLAMAFTIGYTVHCFELFGSRSWFVAFLDASRGTSGWSMTPADIHATANFIAAFASIAGNEMALRLGRARWIRTAMLASALVSCATGWAFGASMSVLAALCLLHMVLVMGDSAALTSGLVASTDPASRGTAMALYSTLGFGGGFIAPLVLGAAIDIGGGAGSALGWQLAFFSLGLAPLLAALLLRFAEPRSRAI